LDYEDLLAHDRELELAKIRARQTDREMLRRTFRRRRGVAVALLAVPIMWFAVAARNASSPSSHAPVKKPAAAATPAAAVTTEERFPEPKEVRAVHIGLDVAGSMPLVNALLHHADPTTGINAVEVDVRDEFGHVGFTEGMPELALTVGAAQTYYEPRILVPYLHRAGMYVIGRVVVFEDPIVAAASPGRAVLTSSGALWRTHSTQPRPWLNPYDTRNWTYAIDIARAAGALGFDEIQFDYVAFPARTAVRPVYRHVTRGSKAHVITAFLKRATLALHLDHLRVSVNMNGMTAQADQGIGQDPRALRGVVDVISPLLYPEAFPGSDYGFAAPQDHPYDLVAAALGDWQGVLANGTAELRPWLQAYTRYGPHYGPTEVLRQVRAVRDAGRTGGFLLWNPASAYDGDALAFPAR
jgi:hypothetical protein